MINNKKYSKSKKKYYKIRKKSVNRKSNNKKKMRIKKKTLKGGAENKIYKNDYENDYKDDYNTIIKYDKKQYNSAASGSVESSSNGPAKSSSSGPLKTPLNGAAEAPSDVPAESSSSCLQESSSNGQVLIQEYKDTETDFLSEALGLGSSNFKLKFHSINTGDVIFKEHKDLIEIEKGNPLHFIRLKFPDVTQCNAIMITCFGPGGFSFAMHAPPGCFGKEIDGDDIGTVNTNIDTMINNQELYDKLIKPEILSKKIYLIMVGQIVNRKRADYLIKKVFKDRNITPFLVNIDTGHQTSLFDEEVFAITRRGNFKGEEENLGNKIDIIMHIDTLREKLEAIIERFPLFTQFSSKLEEENIKSTNVNINNQEIPFSDLVDKKLIFIKQYGEKNKQLGDSIYTF